MRKANIVISILLLSFCGFYGFLIARLPRRNLPNTLGAAFMPWVLMIFLTFLSALLLIKNLLRKGEDEKPRTLSSKQAADLALLFGTFILYMVVMNQLGYLLVTPLFMFALMLVSGSRNWAEMIASSLVVTLAVYLIFHYIFRVPLPVIRFL